MIPLEPNAARLILDRIADGTARVRCQFHAQVSWPPTVTHDDERYFKTGKEGLRRSDTLPCAEYQSRKARRLWLGLDGVVTED